MENENKKSNKSLLIVLVAVVLLAVVAAALYFSGVFTKKDENKKSNTNTNTNSQSNTNSNDNDLVDYPKPATTTSVEFATCSDDRNAPLQKLSIENGKVTLTNAKGVKTTDTSINGEVIAIVEAKASNECGASNDIAVLTKEGAAYLFAGYPLNGEGEVKLKFDKIKSDKKIIGLGVKLRDINNKDSYYEYLYAFTGEKEAHIVKTSDGTLGKTYQELYPYDDILYDNYINELRHCSDKRVIIDNSEYLIFEGKELLVKGIFLKDENDNENTYLLVDEDNSLYTITFGEKYTITKEKKIVKDVQIVEAEDSYGITIQYTDGSKDELKDLSEFNFIGKKK